jgi:lipoate-protein ligase B
MTPKTIGKCWLLELGVVDYDEALDLQLRCEAARKRGDIPDLLILLEHPLVYTFGRGADARHLLIDLADLERRGIKLREIRRGGDVTFHGPGQLVGYPILDLQNHGRDAHLYLRKLENTLKATLEDFDLEAYTVEGMTGVWCGGGKIAAIGVGISRWIATHGFALNVNTDLSYFSGIVPCGLHGKQATSMKTLLSRSIEMDAVRKALSGRFAEEFCLELQSIDPADLITRLNK